MKNKTAYILILGLFLASCDLVGSDTQEKAKPISYTTLLESFQTDTEMNEFETVVLTNQMEATNFLSQFPSDEDTEETLLNVNFADSLVLGVFVGARPNASYTVGIDSLIATGDLNLAYITEIGSASGVRVITWPAHFVVIDKTDFANRNAAFPFKRICLLDPCSWPVSVAPDY